MRPYGYATDSTNTTNTNFHRKLSSINHEMLCRPRMSLSMLSETILSNINALDKMDQCIRHRERFLKKLKPLMESFRILNNKEYRQGNEKEAMKLVLDFLSKPGDFFDLYIEELFKSSASLYLMSVWIGSCSFLVKNPEMMAEKMHPEAPCQSFKSKKTLEALMEDLCGKDLSDFKDSESDDESPPKNTKKNLKRALNLPISGDEEPVAKKTKKKKKTKRDR